MARIACLLCLSLCVWRGVAQQNLDNIDTKEPVLRVSPARSPGEGNDYFGWTAIFHATQELTSGESFQTAQEKIRIIVGAPYGSFAGGLSYNDPFGPREDRTGLVYNCPVAPGNCAGVRGNLGSYINNENLADNTPLGQNVIGHIVTSIQPFMPEEYAEGRLFDQAPNARVTLGNLLGIRNYDYKEGQLLGATLYSNGDVFMACAPRWRLILGSGSNVESIRGMCFSGGRNMQDFVPRMMCTSAATNGIGDNGLDWMCAAGHSAVVNDGNIVVGAPGYTNNRGALIRVRVADPFNTVPTVGDINARGDDGTVLTDAQDQYQGFRTINAHISNTRTSGMPPNLVTSVPRAGINKNGRLNVYASPTTINTLIFTNATGTQIGEFFGYSLAADDFNNDSYDDVLVGAPMYTDFTPNPNKVERGVVYLFINSMRELTDSSRIIINGPSSLPGRARFGSSLAILGDVDRDGYPDFAVGAPYYQASPGSSTGAVFIYYGRADPADIPTQMPFMIAAGTMVSSLNLGMNLNTFGFSLSSGYDVDANGYNDLLVGAYESQSVFLLRSLPVADVYVQFVQHDTVDVDTMKNFTLEIMANFSGVGVADMLSVGFEVTEITGNRPRRVSFSAAKGTGTFYLNGQGVSNTSSVIVFTQSDISDFSAFQFSISLMDISRSVSSPVTGNETLTDLSSFPRLRLQGQTTTQVPVQNICGTDGCESDVSFAPLSDTSIPVVANSPAEGRITVTIMNEMGREPALNLQVIVTMLPEFVTRVSTFDDIFSCMAETDTVCTYQRGRLNGGESVEVTFVFTFNVTGLIGNEPNEMISLQLNISEVDGNRDNSTLNNNQTLTLEPTAEADISISSVMFSPERVEYTAVAPTTNDLLNEGVTAFNTEVTLEVTVGNVGPSIIQDATLEIFFPARLESVTGANTFLYPYDIQGAPEFTCNRSMLDPSGIQRNSVNNRGKRSIMSLSEKMAQKRHNRAVSSSLGMDNSIRRAKRQDTIVYDFDCRPSGSATESPMRSECTVITCAINNLGRDNVSVSLRSRVDERFYSNQPSGSGPGYNLRAYASVRVENSYIRGDDANNNGGFDGIEISRVAPAPPPPDLLHLILWPSLAALILLVIIVVVLYFCGFFRRKKKHGDDEVVEGDFEVPTDGGGKSFSPESKPAAKEEMTGL